MFFSIRLPFFISTGIISLTFFFFSSFLPQSEAKADSSHQDVLDTRELVRKSDVVFKSFLEDPNMAWFHDNVGTARGVFIVPQMLRGNFIGGASGSGVLLAHDLITERWSYPGFYTINSVSMGLQIGADASEIILMVMTEKGMHAMLSPGFKIGTDVTAAAGSIGRKSSQKTADIIAFAHSMMGIFRGISLGGAVITPCTEWNKAYYGKPVSPEDILIRRSASNYLADPLRKSIPGVKQLPEDSLGKKRK